MYKIYYNNKWIKLTGGRVEKTENEKKVEYENTDTFDFVQKVLNTNKELQGILIEYADPHSLYEKFIKHYRLIFAAGGLVENENGEILIIFRNGKWDLPKGKLKKGEDEREGAIREVEEECNVKGLKILAELKPSHHIYELKGQLVVKKTWWYKMSCSEVQHLIPQTDEGITKVEWFKKKNLEEVFSNTFPSIKDVLNEYLGISP